MPSQVLYLGPVRSGKTRELLRLYRAAIRAAAPAGAAGRALWLAPTSRSAAAVRKQILDDGLEACLAPGVTTFDQLTAEILTAAADGRVASAPRLTTLSPAAARELLRRAIKSALARGELSHYRAAAARTGFVDLLIEHIRELKQHGLDPAAYAKASKKRDRTDQHRELALLYAEYRRQLDDHALCDSAGSPLAACEALASGACDRFQQLELVVVDGFTDFTQAQHELLRLLAARAKQLFITLPSDDINSQQPFPRADLFAKVAATRAELRHFHPQLEIRSLPPIPIEWPALDHLARHLFGNPRQIPPLPDVAHASLAHLEILEAAGPHDEFVQIARHVKRRLSTMESRPADIIVAVRSLADAAPRIREVFTDFGIPHSLETGQPLATAAVLKTLLALLRLADEDWPFRRVVAVLTNNSLTSIDAGARRAADWLVRDLQFASGRDKLLERAEQLANANIVDSNIAPGSAGGSHDENSSKTLPQTKPPAEPGADGRNPKNVQLSDHAQRRADEATNALPALKLLAGALDELPETASPLDWHAALTQLGKQLGIEPFTERRTDNPVRPEEENDGPDCPSHDTLNRAAWQALTTHFAALDRLDRALGAAPRQLTRRELLTWLVDLAGHESLPRPHDDTGCVRVLSAATARSISARHLYLAGMSEQAFPSPERTGRLATDADYRFFVGALDQDFAAASPQAATRSQGEMLLFYEVLTRAEESVTISYPALDDKAQQLPPSPYVTEVLRTLGTATSHVKRTPPHLSPIPPADTPPSSAADWRIQAVAQALGRNPNRRLLAGLFQSPQNLSEPGRGHRRAAVVGPRSEFPNLPAALEAGLRIIHARQRRDDFGPTEGLLTSPAAAVRLASRYGPAHLWSPSQWEHYARCPFQFYLEHVLKLEPLGDLALEIDHRRRGSILHQVLAAFHRQYGASPAEAWHALQRDDEQFVAEIRRTLEEAISATPRHGIDAALVELDRRQIEKWTGQYGAQHRAYDAAWTEFKFDTPPLPTHFELRFGPRRPGDENIEDPRSTDTAFPLDIGGETILVTGRIDRIDVGTVGDRKVFNVIDYKSGRRPTLTGEKLETGERLQPAVYVMAAEMLLFKPGEAAPMWAGYWSMQNGVNTDARFSLQCSANGIEANEEWKELRPKIERRIGQFVTDIRQGKFPVASRDPHCTSRCEFNTVCRVAQVRSLGKTWIPDE